MVLQSPRSKEEERVPVNLTRSIAIAVKQQPHLTQPFPGYVTLLFKYNNNLQYCLCTYAEFCMNNNYYKYKTSENFDAFTRLCGWQMSAKAVSKAFVFAGEGTKKLSSVITDRMAVVNKIYIKKSLKTMHAQIKYFHNKDKAL